MKRHTMFLVLALAMIFAYASAHAQRMGGTSPGMGQSSPGMQNPNNNPNNPNSTYPGMGNSQSPQASDNTAKVSDSDLQNAVKSKLASDPAFANVQAAVEKGKVTLDGNVNSKQDKKKAKNAVKSIAGVRGVKDNLMVNGNDAKNQPKSSSAAGPGNQFLSSQEASQNTAGSIAGNSQTSANPTSNAPQATAPEAGSMGQSGSTPGEAVNDNGLHKQGDMGLQKQIETSIKNDPALTDSSVNVDVSANFIELNGTVGSSRAKMNVERIAQSYAQNRKVHDNLQVTGAGNSDLNNGHSAMSNGPAVTPSSTGNMPKGDSSQMPASNPSSQAPSDQTTPR